jgi:hypothetical protein
MPRRVKLASLLAFVLHGVLILTTRYRLSYDAYNHMFFADHYQQGWWSLWEPRWYTGFEVVSYPPLMHQLMAVLGHVIGVDAAFGLLLWASLTAYPLGIYLFSRIFVGRVAAGNAALGAALLPSLYLTAHVFGQLPTLVATLLALFGAVVLADFLRHGGFLTGVLAVFLFASVMAAHHATLLFLPWLVGAVTLKILVDKKIHRFAIFLRLGIFSICTLLAGWLVIFPFWEWGLGQTIQATIDHPSRHNFFQDPFAAILFFLPMYGLFIPLIPIALWMGRRRRFWGLSLAFLFLFLLGLGDTTPLPRLLFRSGWGWLTYDRFAFWASLFLLPFFGAAVVLLQRRSSMGPNPLPPSLVGKGVSPQGTGVRSHVNIQLKLIFLASMTFIALLIGLIPTWLPTQPPQLDMQPIVDFLDQGDNANWRYLTFGFGDQLAYLSRLTNATTIDGSYHTARSLPELRASGIGQIDTAYWIPNGLDALDPILQKSGERGVRWGFVNLKMYVPILLRNGWRPLARLANGVSVWENPTATLPPPVEPPPEKPFKAFAWGAFPLFCFFLTGALAIRRYRPTLSERILPGIQSFAIGLLPLGLTFWAYRRLFAIPHERIYFTYSDALFFLSDGIAVVVVLAWLVGKIPIGPLPTLPKIQKTEFKGGIFRMMGWEGAWFFALLVIAILSTLWSLDWRTSLYVTLQSWLAFGLFLTLCGRPSVWRSFALGSVAALFLQVVIGIWQVVSQSTVFTMSLDLDWPGNIIPSMSGASVVQLVDGVRWLRAYGTFPHPNILGGWNLALLASLLTLILLPQKRRLPALILFGAGLILLVLTFSRSAWLGLVATTGILFVRRKRLDRKSLHLISATGVLCIALVFIPLRQMFFTRLFGTQIQTEQASNFTRFWLVQRTGELIRQRPILGVGVGSYSLALSGHVPDFYDIEPVHNIPLLVWSELGLGGLVAVSGLVLTIAIRSFKIRRPQAIVFSAALAGLFVVSLFDHYLWTLAPGRMLFAAMLGLWSGQVHDERGS